MSMKPWRKVAIPHDDVSAGRFQQAQFAADMSEVLKGTAQPEYQDPAEFFARTYLTEGMKRLLKSALERVSGAGGDPVVKLKTSFGGGKTHTMLALYHMFGGTDPKKLQGVPELMKETKLSKMPKCNVAVLVGTALDATQTRSHPKHKGITVSTLWGELAIQLGGKEGYELVRKADEKGAAPGSDTLTALFDKYGPCVILIDELVAYARNIYKVEGLPSGSFDSNMTFVQNLTEAVKKNKTCILVASIPDSDIEIGGEGGEAALERIEHTFGRVEAIWQPVGHIESFEIVRRRLFSKVMSENDRDDVCSAFHKMYRDQSTEFPTPCKEKEYLDRLKAAYPFHPEFFDRLYEDWATMEKFQRTRGVLRLMALVIHELWTKNDQSYLIMPSNLPLYAPKIRDELTRYVGTEWSIVVDNDVDGEQSEPARIDNEVKRIGAQMGARRVARTVFLGSAPSVRQQNLRGIEDINIRLGVAQPDDNLAVYADALSRLTDKLTFLYRDGKRYWYDIRPNLRRTVENKAAMIDQIDIENDLIERLQEIRDRKAFARVHVTSDPASVPDEQEARLVILGPQEVYKADRMMSFDSPALIKAKAILDSKGSGPRIYKNTLLFLAPDSNATANCLQEIRMHMAWQKVIDEEDTLGLSTSQKRQAIESEKKAESTVKLKMVEAYCWLLVPGQDVSAESGPGDVRWDVTRLPGSHDGDIVARASKKAVPDHLIKDWSPVNRKLELDRYLWKEKDSIDVKQLWDYMTTYLYLSRLSNVDVLTAAIQDGIKTKEYFAYAAGKDATGKYLGLNWQTLSQRILVDGTSVLVKPEIAEKYVAPSAQPEPPLPPEGGKPGDGEPGGRMPQEPVRELPKRFHGSVVLDPQRVGRDAGQIASEVIAHLTALPDAEVTVTLEIQAKLPKGAPDKDVQTVTENARTLKFRESGFEKE
ncbi:MAG: DUF499 domain-containing protein [Rectinemataceae bacterium]|nr:DUF499 domain-containing protein [Rectinemataceae bacterium]